MGEFKYWKVGKHRVRVIERFRTSTLIEYVKSGLQASVSTSLVIACKAKSYVVKNPKKETPSVVKQIQNNNINKQTSLEL